MKKRLITVIAALALLMLTAASAATAGGVLVRQDDGNMMITGTLRDADSHIGKVYGTLGELTTGFNTCPDFEFYCSFGGNTPTCNLLGGEVTLKFQAQYDAQVSNTIDGRVGSSLCKNPDGTYQLRLFLWSTSQVPPGAFPDVFYVFATVEQITPDVFKWS